MGKKFLLSLIILGLFFNPGCLGKKNLKFIKAHGRIELEEIQISPKVAGRIEKLIVEEGDRITQGQILGYLDLYERRKKDLERARLLYQTGAIPQTQLEDAEIIFREQFLVSPINGVVLLKTKFQGETILPGQVVLVLGDLKNVYAKIYINEKDLGQIKLGGTAQITVDSLPDKKFTGALSYISDSAEFTPKNIQTEEERTRRVYALKVKLNNAQEELKPGMYCDAVI